MSLEFEFTIEGMHNLAAYVAQLVREGVTFQIRQERCRVSVTLTGGY